MTPQEAINNIDDVLSSDVNYDESLDYELTSDDIDWLEKAKEALKKQIPKKPILKETKCFDGSTADFVFVCPVCNRKICSEPTDDIMASFLKEEYPHCNCGQALDWSDIE